MSKFETTNTHLVSVSLKPEKFIYTQQNENCRMKPYNELIYERIYDDLRANCNNSCRLPNYFLCDYYMNALRSMNICTTKNEDFGLSLLLTFLSKYVLTAPVL